MSIDGIPGAVDQKMPAEGVSGKTRENPKMLHQEGSDDQNGPTAREGDEVCNLISLTQAFP